MSNTKSDEIDYKSLKSELDNLLINLQADDLDVDEALVLYKRGLELMKQLNDYLKEAQNTVKDLKAKFDKG